MDVREALENGTFTAYGPPETRLYATLEGGHTVAIKTVYQLDKYADRITGFYTGQGIVIRKA